MIEPAFERATRPTRRLISSRIDSPQALSRGDQQRLDGTTRARGSPSCEPEIVRLAQWWRVFESETTAASPVLADDDRAPVLRGLGGGRGRSLGNWPTRGRGRSEQRAIRDRSSRTCPTIWKPRRRPGPPTPGRRRLPSRPTPSPASRARGRPGAGPARSLSGVGQGPGEWSVDPQVGQAGLVGFMARGSRRRRSEDASIDGVIRRHPSITARPARLERIFHRTRKGCDRVIFWDLEIAPPGASSRGRKHRQADALQRVGPSEKAF